MTPAAATRPCAGAINAVRALLKKEIAGITAEMLFRKINWWTKPTIVEAANFLVSASEARRPAGSLFYYPVGTT